LFESRHNIILCVGPIIAARKQRERAPRDEDQEDTQQADTASVRHGRPPSAPTWEETNTLGCRVPVGESILRHPPASSKKNRTQPSRQRRAESTAPRGRRQAVGFNPSPPTRPPHGASGRRGCAGDPGKGVSKARRGEARPPRGRALTRLGLTSSFGASSWLTGRREGILPATNPRRESHVPDGPSSAGLKHPGRGRAHDRLHLPFLPDVVRSR
jgi:hypothetical protein